MIRLRKCLRNLLLWLKRSGVKKVGIKRIILALYPLFSEVSILGISVKKEIENIKTENKLSYIDLKGQLVDVKSSITQIASINPSFVNNNYLGQSPSEKEMEKTEETLEKDTDGSIDIQNETIESEFSPNDNALYLFQTRYTLEKYLLRFHSKLFQAADDDSFIRTDRMINDLRNSDVIDYITSSALKQVFTICNRGIHGKAISEDHVNFVKKNIKLIYQNIEKATQRLGYKPFILCNDCGFAGSAEENNICPKCGHRVQA